MTTGVSVPASLRSLRVAIVHDYLNQTGGAEKVVEVLAGMFPDAPIYTSVYDRDRMPDLWRSFDIRTSFMQRISPRLGIAKALLPLYPSAFESYDLRGYDLVLSSTTSFAKGVITRPETCHICYCHSPTRFLWMYHDSIQYARFPPGVTRILPFCTTPLRSWDFAAAQRVDYFIASSDNAARRIDKYYRRQSDVVQAPIDAARFAAADRVEDYFLVISRLQSYKRIDLAIEACTRLGLPLHVAGEGPDRDRLESLAGPTVRFLGRISDGEVRDEMAHCQAFLFPGEEDFGLTALEAQASGRPVIAYRGGGALETVVDGETGVFFDEPTVDSLCAVLSSFEDTFDPTRVRAHACRFDKSAFERRFYDVVARRYAEHRGRVFPGTLPQRAQLRG